MRLLFLLQGQKPDDQIGYHRAFVDMLNSGRLTAYHPLPYRAYGTPTIQHWPRLYSNGLDLIRSMEIDILFLQFFHGQIPDPRPFLTEARKINPHLLVLVSCGDPFGRWFLPPPPSLRQAASMADLTFSTSMGYIADILVSSGTKNLVFMPNGICQERFAKPLQTKFHPEFDIIFIGSNNGGRNPLTHLSRAGSHRRAMVKALELRYGARFALYGRGWEGNASWRGPAPYADQHSLARKSRIQIGGFPGSKAMYYTSDRFYIALGSGIPFADFAVPGVDSLAEPEKHWIPYRNLPEMLRRIDWLLGQPQAALDAMGAESRTFVIGHHTQAHRAQEMLQIAQTMREARALGRKAGPPLLNCFHSGIDPALELPRAVRNWCG